MSLGRLARGIRRIPVAYLLCDSYKHSFSHLELAWHGYGKRRSLKKAKMMYQQFRKGSYTKRNGDKVPMKRGCCDPPHGGTVGLPPPRVVALGATGRTNVKVSLPKPHLCQLHRASCAARCLPSSRWGKSIIIQFSFQTNHVLSVMIFLLLSLQQWMEKEL